MVPGLAPVMGHGKNMVVAARTCFEAFFIPAEDPSREVRHLKEQIQRLCVPVIVEHMHIDGAVLLNRPDHKGCVCPFYVVMQGFPPAKIIQP